MRFLIKTMQQTMQYLCENAGDSNGIPPSDEITLKVFLDYKKFSSAAFFDYEVQ